jgi:hypothetical protein
MPKKPIPPRCRNIDRAPGQPNPFVVGPDAVQRFLTVLGECALATKASIGEDAPGR